MVSLVLILSISIYAFDRRLSAKDTNSHIDENLIWPRFLLLLPLWLLCLVWTGYASFMLGVMSLLGESIPFLLVAVSLPFGFGLVSWLLFRWIRGNSFADVTLIIIILIGSTAVYSKQTIWLCEPLARSGMGIAQLCSGRLYEQGSSGVIRNPRTSRDWYQRAANKQLATAEYWIGMHSRPIDEKKDWLQRAAQQKHIDAAYQLYVLAPQDTDALQWLQFSADEGHADAQYTLGLLYRGGSRLSVDFDRSRELWLKAAQQGSLLAMRALAIAYAQGDAVFDYDPDASKHWETQALAAEKTVGKSKSNTAASMSSRTHLKNIRARRDAADAGDTTALLEIASQIKNQAKDDPTAIKKSMEHIEKAAQKGSINAQYKIADYYLNRESSSASEREQGRKWLIKSANNGHEQALRKLIRSLKEGNDGFEIDLYQSKQYSEALFEQLKKRNVRPNQSAWMTAGWEYKDTLKQIRKLENRYLPTDELKQATNAGDAKAKYYLSKELMRTDFDQALKLLEAAAHGGYAQAQYDMNKRISRRKHTDQEKRQAIQWLITAANSGHRAAMVSLGNHYRSGFARQNIQRDLYQAKLWYQQAIDGVDKIVYQEKNESGRGWLISVASVKKKLDALPDYIIRLDIEGLSDPQRQAAINLWHETEWQSLSKQADMASGKEATEMIAAMNYLNQQKKLLLKRDDQ